ncbi:MAG: protein translocase subunit SecF, partial [Pelagibacterales bacterium]|nr:protein translocase subunit SecF [Pelagibacterales bacterium]
LIFGGEVLRGFAFAITFGIIVGTYSSIYIASPILMYFKVKRDWSVKIDNTP